MPTSLDPGQRFTLDLYGEGGYHVTSTLSLGWRAGDDAHTLSVNLTTDPAAQCATAQVTSYLGLTPLVPAVLNATGSGDPNASPDTLPYFWQVTSAPEGSRVVKLLDRYGHDIAGQFSDEAEPRILVDVPGPYTVTLTVSENDASCQAATATAELYAQPRGVMELALTWDKQGGDHDLHLVRPGGAFASITNDCNPLTCYAPNEVSEECPARGCPGPMNAPDWGTSGVRNDDPILVAADSTGFGPEILRLDHLESGDYAIAVDNVAGGTTTRYDLFVTLFGGVPRHYSGTISAGNGHHVTVAVLHVGSDGSAALQSP